MPTISESGVFGYEVGPWFGVLVPARTPPALATRLNSEIVKVLRTPAIRERFAVEGVEPVGSTPAQFASHLKLELVRWGKVIKDAGIRVDCVRTKTGSRSRTNSLRSSSISCGGGSSTSIRTSRRTP